MNDLLELMSRDPLSYTTDGKELETIIAKMREGRAAFNLGNLRAGSMKAGGRAFSARCTPSSAGDGPAPSPGTSSSTTGTPAEAASAAIPLPIVPAPTTPTVRIRMRAPGRARPAGRCSLAGGGPKIAASRSSTSTPTIAWSARVPARSRG